MTEQKLVLSYDRLANEWRFASAKRRHHSHGVFYLGTRRMFCNSENGYMPTAPDKLSLAAILSASFVL